MSYYRSHGFQRFPSGVPLGVGRVSGMGSGESTDRGDPPSTYAVLGVLEGQDGSLLRLAGLTLLRGCFIFPGLWVAARLLRVELEPLELLGLSFAGSATISAGMLGYYWIRGGS